MYQFDTSMAVYALKQTGLMLSQSQQMFNQMIDESVKLNRALFDFEVSVVPVDEAMALMFPEQSAPAPAKKKSAVAKPASQTKAIASPPVRADDLKLISGVGPGLEKKLKDAGISTFAQIAALSDAEIVELETHVIKFAGRIQRDGWIEQAKALMAAH